MMIGDIRPDDLRALANVAKAWTQQVVDAVFTFLSYPGQPIRLGGAAQWDTPKLNEKMAAGILRQIAIRNGADPAAAYAHPDPTVDFSPRGKPQA